MKWSEDAEAAIRKVPFFVRKKVRARVEKEAAERGKTRITLSEVADTRKRFLSTMDSEIKGYQVDTCFGGGTCPNTCVSGDSLITRIEDLLRSENLRDFLKKRVRGDLKFHHEFRISVAECPNACSQPQIKDIGIIAAKRPTVGASKCSLCFACVDVCKEKAVQIDEHSGKPVIDFSACISCGACIRVCPTGTLETAQEGFRVLLGGRLGRHPRLARELDGLFSEDRVLAIVRECLSFYKTHCKNGERFAVLLDDKTFDALNRKNGSSP